MSTINEESNENVEHERRFLVCGREWAELGHAEHLYQGYLNTDKDRTVRVRIKGDKAFFTVKGRTVGNEKPEIETEIPVDKAQAILEHPQKLCIGYPIEKTRRTIEIGDLTWEVDEFARENQGLIIAEVEYKGPKSGKDAWNQKVNEERPTWTGVELTVNDPEYFNSRLTEDPFSLWTKEKQAPMHQHAAGCD